MTVVAMPATTTADRTVRLLPAALLLAGTVVALWASAPYVVGVFHDDGVYALLARSIASGTGFHYSHLPGAPAATHYPPLYPLLLGLVWRLAPSFPDNLPALLALNALLVGIATYGWFAFATTRLLWRRDAAAAGAVVATLAAPVLALSGALLSEPLFLALLWPALMRAEHTAGADRTPAARESRDAVGTGVVIGALMLARTHGIALLGALLLVLALRTRWRAMVLTSGAATLVQLPWVIWSATASPRVAGPLEGSYGSYLGWFVIGVRDGGISFVAATTRVNLHECWLLLQDRIAPGAPAVVLLPLMLLLVAGLSIGLWSIAQRAPVTAVFVVAYFGVVMVWPYTPWRFAWAVWPLVALTAFEGVRAGWKVGGGVRVLAAAAAVLLAWPAARTEAREFRARSWREPASRAATGIMPLVEWVRHNTTPNDVVLAEGEQVIALYTGRQAAPPIAFTAREYLRATEKAERTAALRAMIGAVPARYLVTLAPDLQHAARAWNEAPALREIAAAPPALVFEIVR